MRTPERRQLIVIRQGADAAELPMLQEAAAFSAPSDSVLMSDDWTCRSQPLEAGLHLPALHPRVLRTPSGAGQRPQRHWQGPGDDSYFSVAV